MSSDELEDRINTLEMFVGGHESDGMRSDIKLIGEALGIIGRVLVRKRVVSGQAKHPGGAQRSRDGL